MANDASTRDVLYAPVSMFEAGLISRRTADALLKMMKRLCVRLLG